MCTLTYTALWLKETKGAYVVCTWLFNLSNSFYPDPWGNDMIQFDLRIFFGWLNHHRNDGEKIYLSIDGLKPDPTWILLVGTEGKSCYVYFHIPNRNPHKIIKLRKLKEVLLRKLQV